MLQSVKVTGLSKQAKKMRVWTVRFSSIGNYLSLFVKRSQLVFFSFWFVFQLVDRKKKDVDAVTIDTYSGDAGVIFHTHRSSSSSSSRWWIIIVVLYLLVFRPKVGKGNLLLSHCIVFSFFFLLFLDSPTSSSLSDNDRSGFLFFFFFGLVWFFDMKMMSRYNERRPMSNVMIFNGGGLSS